MKKILLLLALSGSANAATYDLGSFSSDASVHFGKSYLPVGNWSDDYTFSVRPQGADGSVQIGWTRLTTADINAEIVNVVTLATTQVNQLVANFSIAAGDYALRVYGSSTKATDSYAGTVDLKITQTPVPGALLLFASALVGLIGLRAK